MDQNPNEAQVSPKQQVAERVRQAVNVLVTVRSNPSVDELAATIGLTLMLNKLGKHATAVFSGQIPSTLEFLKPEETLESNTDSLRDFIISLDKSKADKLRYKVEENVVKIFITPYRTSISEKDLEFTQGDFNVDVILALGVTQREELDQAITSHGRILHDATVVTITAGQRESTIGNINWQEPGASSLSEMLVSISEAFQGGLIDAQMATAFLTGIVAETERFSNPKTTPKVMTMAAQLMAAGANQQLIANELQKNGPAPNSTDTNDTNPPEENGEGGSLSIDHDGNGDKPPAPPADGGAAPAQTQPENPPLHSEPFIPAVHEDSFNPLMPPPDKPATETPSESILPPPPSQDSNTNGQIHIDEEGNLMRQQAEAPKHKVVQPLAEQSEPLPPQPVPAEEVPFSSQTATQPEPQNNADPLTLPVPHDLPAVENKTEDIQPDPSFTPPDGGLPHVAETHHNAPQVDDDETLVEIEQSVQSPHLSAQEAALPAAEIDSARNAVLDAINQTPYDPTRPEPRADLGAQFGPPLQPEAGFPMPPSPTPEQTLQSPAENQQDNSLPPPPIPPPLVPPSV